MSDKVFTLLGANNFSKEDREKDDFYATHPDNVKLLLEQEKFNGLIWEPACGQGHISKELLKHGYVVYSSDLFDRGFGLSGQDFLQTKSHWPGDIITNPPYKYALEFTQKALSLINDESKVAMLLRIQFLEGKKRREFFNVHPPKTVYVASSRMNCAKNGDFEKYLSSAMCFAWFVWQKGRSKETVVKWIN